MHPWIIRKMQEEQRQRQARERVQPRLPVPEPHQHQEPLRESQQSGSVIVNFEL